MRARAPLTSLLCTRSKQSPALFVYRWTRINAKIRCHKTLSIRNTHKGTGLTHKHILGNVTQKSDLNLSVHAYEWEKQANRTYDSLLSPTSKTRREEKRQLSGEGGRNAPRTCGLITPNTLTRDWTLHHSPEKLSQHASIEISVVSRFIFNRLIMFWVAKFKCIEIKLFSGRSIIVLFSENGVKTL